MADGVRFSIEHGPEWDRAIAELTFTSATLATEIRDAVARLVDPWIIEAEARVGSMPIKGVGRQSGLRAEVAGSVNKSVTGPPGDFDVEVTSSLPAGTGEENEKIIPLGLDRPEGWRHPVFGNMSNWVQQVPLRHEWFSGPFENRQEDVSREIQKVLDQARDRIARTGG